MAHQQPLRNTSSVLAEHKTHLLFGSAPFLSFFVCLSSVRCIFWEASAASSKLVRKLRGWHMEQAEIDSESSPRGWAHLLSRIPGFLDVKVLYGLRPAARVQRQATHEENWSAA